MSKVILRIFLFLFDIVFCMVGSVMNRYNDNIDIKLLMVRLKIK